MTTYRIATLPGDGVGPEIVAETIRVLEAVQQVVTGFELVFEKHPAGAGTYLRTGEALPADTYEACRTSDAILLGSMGLPDVRRADGTEVQGHVIVRMRQDFELFAGVRPVKLYPGVPGPLAEVDAIDMVIVRENTEGLFASFGGGFGIGDDVVGDAVLVSRRGTQRVSEYAFDLTRTRNGRLLDGKRLVTCVDKANIFRSFSFFRKVFDEVAARQPSGVDYDHVLVDAMMLLLVRRPQDYDVVVTENMFGDIMSDLTAALVGGMGMAPSGDIGAERAMFQPAHGSAPTIAGEAIANPVATVLSGAMMLNWLDRDDHNPALSTAAQLLDDAVAAALGSGAKTRDIGGTTGTSGCADAIIAAVRELGPSPGTYRTSKGRS